MEIEFTIGADPEFGCIDRKSKRLINGVHYFPYHDEEFGVDGCTWIFEVRPEPSKDPLELIRNIQDIFVRTTISHRDFLNKFEWIAPTWFTQYEDHRPNKEGFCFAGHIHFGTKGFIGNEEATNFLDHYLGSISILLENKEDGILRRKQQDSHGINYGQMGDMRPQNHGFEYRALSTWISSPSVSTAVLCLAKCIMYEILNNPKFQWKKFVEPNDFFHMKQGNVWGKFPEIWKDIQKMILYPKYKKYIDVLYFCVIKKKSWTSPRKMKDNWGVVDVSHCINKQVSMDYIWK